MYAIGEKEYLAGMERQSNFLANCTRDGWPFDY